MKPCHALESGNYTLRWATSVLKGSQVMWWTGAKSSINVTVVKVTWMLEAAIQAHPWSLHGYLRPQGGSPARGLVWRGYITNSGFFVSWGRVEDCKRHLAKVGASARQPWVLDTSVTSGVGQPFLSQTTLWFGATPPGGCAFSCHLPKKLQISMVNG